MEKILYIKANPKPVTHSSTLKVAEDFIEKYRDASDGVEVTELDLYREGLNHVDLESLGKIFSENENELTKYADDFLKYDKYIIAAPMWNLSIPSILKTYIDHITVAGKTFRYTENGPEGLLKGKKIAHITSRGGNYSSGPGADFEMGDRYLRTIFGFMGVEDFNTIAFENTAIHSQEEVAERVDEFNKTLSLQVEKFRG